jgi:hypothetical protein
VQNWCLPNRQNDLPAEKFFTGSVMPAVNFLKQFVIKCESEDWCNEPSHPQLFPTATRFMDHFLCFAFFSFFRSLVNRSLSPSQQFLPLWSKCRDWNHFIE